MSQVQFQTGNRLLSRLTQAGRDLLEPHLEPVDLPVHHHLEVAGRSIKNVYFVDSGIASVVANSNHQSIEVGLIGREGMTGLAVLMGIDRTPQDTFMQVAGNGHSIPTNELRTLFEQNANLHRVFLRYGFAFVLQAGQTALANGRSKIEDRLCRWLLMAHDRVDGDEVALTHEFLSLMLGVRRAGVSVALGKLTGAGLIELKRGTIIIRERAGLEKHANGSYGAPDAEFHRDFG